VISDYPLSLLLLQVRVRGFSERPFDTLDTLSTTKSPVENVEPDIPTPDDIEETSGFYQSVMAWKSLQEWAQRAWAKHYQQSPIGSTQNVEPIIVQGLAPLGLGQPQLISRSPDEQLHGEVKTADGHAEKDALRQSHDNVMKNLSFRQSAIHVPKLTVACEAEILPMDMLDSLGNKDRNYDFVSPPIVATNNGSDQGNEHNKLITVAPTCQNQLVPIDQSCQNQVGERLPSTRSSKYSKSRCNHSSIISLYFLLFGVLN